VAQLIVRIHRVNGARVWLRARVRIRVRVGPGVRITDSAMQLIDLWKASAVINSTISQNTPEI
jgi:phosphoribosylformimino-5-aminoimidazole carboxamide ribonucleotide (ProFAR) isomerase